MSDRVDALVLQGSRALDRGMIYIRKAPSRPLADLIERITSGNMHEPIFNEPIGFERW